MLENNLEGSDIGSAHQYKEGVAKSHLPMTTAREQQPPLERRLLLSTSEVVVLRVTAQWSINNELRVSVGTDAVRPPLRSDRADSKRLTRQGEAFEQYRGTTALLDRLLRDSKEMRTIVDSDGTQLDLFGSHQPINPVERREKVLPDNYTYIDWSPSGRAFVAQRSTSEVVADRDRALDILSESQHVSKRHLSHGRAQTPKSFTRAARHSLLEAGAAIDKLGLRESASLLTLTIPGSTDAAYEAVSRWSGWIVNRQLQHVRRYMKGRPCYWFFVWEFQKRGALHQHWCLAGSDYAESRHLTMLMKDAWYQCLKEIGEKEGIDLFARKGNLTTWANSPDKWQWDEQKVRKSVGKYFSKYATKSHTQEPGEASTRRSKLYYPSRWHGSSKGIKDVIKSHRLKVVIPNISKADAIHLESSIIELVEQFEIVRAYGFKYRVESKEHRTIAEGQTTILYISDAEYSVARTALSQFLGSVESRSEGVVPVIWELQSAQMNRHGVVSGSSTDLYLGVGLQGVYR